ncbi:MAG: hypothetical protein EPO36_14100 [Chloroflexota bacterium]|nr:MAG: hypothetical protein EPO36_14100 [Chloroflexota bacterium]
MNPALAGVALAVTAGAVIAASSREARAALVGLALVLGFGPFLAEPLPGAAILGARVVTGVLVVYLLWAVTASNESPGLGSRIGWPAETAIALGVAIAGVAMASGLASLDPSLPPPAEAPDPLDALTPAALALGAGLASLVVGLAPAFFGRGALRTAVGLLLVVQGLVLARTGLAGPPGALEQLGIDGLLLTLGTSAALIAIIERRSAGDAEPGDSRRGDDGRPARATIGTTDRDAAMPSAR